MHKIANKRKQIRQTLRKTQIQTIFKQVRRQLLQNDGIYLELQQLQIQNLMYTFPQSLPQIFKHFNHNLSRKFLLQPEKWLERCINIKSIVGWTRCIEFITELLKTNPSYQLTQTLVQSAQMLICLRYESFVSLNKQHKNLIENIIMDFYIEYFKSSVGLTQNYRQLFMNLAAQTFKLNFCDNECQILRTLYACSLLQYQNINSRPNLIELFAKQKWNAVNLLAILQAAVRSNPQQMTTHIIDLTLTILVNLTYQVQDSNFYKIFSQPQLFSRPFHIPDHFCCLFLKFFCNISHSLPLFCKYLNPSQQIHIYEQIDQSQIRSLFQQLLVFSRCN